jgi:hypothetical protein
MQFGKRVFLDVAKAIIDNTKQPDDDFVRGHESSSWCVLSNHIIEDVRAFSQSCSGSEILSAPVIAGAIN